MSEIYWISRLDGILVVLGIICAISFVMFFCFAVMAFVDGKDELLMSNKQRNKLIKISAITIVISGILLVFIPSSKESITIWGIGQTIDYVQSNETLQGLPDKCVQALDVWLDSVMEKEE